MASELTDKEMLSLLRSMDPYEFEEVVGEVWSNIGYTTNVLRGSNDRGIDVIAKTPDPFPRTQLIQVKKYSPENKIGSKTIREYRTLYEQEPTADRAILVTTGYFTR